TPPHESYRVRKCQCSGSDQCGIFSEAVSCNNTGPKALCLQHPAGSNRYCKNRRLRVLRYFQVLFRTIEAKSCQRESENPVGFLEDFAGFSVVAEKLTAHSGVLGSLTRENKGCLHEGRLCSCTSGQSKF